MKFLSMLIWLSWSAICARIALAPTLRLTLSESLVLLLVCAPVVGVLCWVRWVLRPSQQRRVQSSETPEQVPGSKARQRLADVENYPGVVGERF